MRTIRGLTWDHPRAREGLFAATADFMRAHPGTEVLWDTHPLRGFESTPIEQLADRYDLIILDHPFMGDVAQSGCLLDLTTEAGALDLAGIAGGTVGKSFATYSYEGHWAVPIDAACQVAVYRPDRVSRPPRTWSEVVVLARSVPVGVALGTVHSLMTFFTLCSNLGAPPGSVRDQPLVAREAGHTALARLRALRDWRPHSLKWNAIDLQEAMASSENVAYCPYVYGYVSYALPGKYAHQLAFADMPSADDSGAPAGSTIGGTGLAISRRCVERVLALEFASFLTRAEVQIATGLAGGQPAHRSAWQSEALNASSGQFYRDTLATLEAAVIRPRYPKYMTLQNEGGEIVGRHLRGSLSADQTLAALDAVHHRLLGC